MVGLPGKTTLQCTVFFAMFFLKKQQNDICMNLIGMIILIHINTLMMNDIVIAAIIPLCSEPFCSVGVGFGYLNTHRIFGALGIRFDN